MEAKAVAIGYIQSTDAEYEKYWDIACHTNSSTDLNIFTPLCGLLKVLKRSSGLRNTVNMLDPEDPSQAYRISYPVTALDDPHKSMLVDIKDAIRPVLRENISHLDWSTACRNSDPLVRSLYLAYISWHWMKRVLTQTITSDFLICSHPSTSPQAVPFTTGNSSLYWASLPSNSRRPVLTPDNGRRNQRCHWAVLIHGSGRDLGDRFGAVQGIQDSIDIYDSP